MRVRVAQPDEPRGLVGTVHVERAAQELRLVGHDPHRSPSEAGETRHHVARPIGFHREEITVVDDGLDHLVDVVSLARIGGDDVVQFLGPAVDRIATSR